MTDFGPGFHDNLYIFSVSDENFGRIVEYRTAEALSGGNLDLFELLGISDAEKNFAKSRISAFISFPVLVVGADAETNLPTAVLLVPNFAYACLAFQLLMPAGEACRLFADGLLGEIALSEGARLLAASAFPSEEHYSYLSMLMEKLLMPAATRSRYAPIEHHEISRILAAAQAVTGCEMTVRVVENNDTCEDQTVFPTKESLPGAIFSQGYLMIAMLILLAEARRYSKDKRAVVLIRGASDVLEIEVAFRSRDKSFNRYALNFLERAAEYNGMLCEYKVDSGRVDVLVKPFYADVGLTGVKTRLRLI